MSTANRWFFEMYFSLVAFKGALFYDDPRHEGYFVNLFYYLDCVANAFSGGNHLVTVSARVGFYRKRFREADSYKQWYWRVCESIINFTFRPMDGPDHCEQARVWTLEYLHRLEGDHEPDIYQGPLLFLSVLLVLIIVACIFLIPIIRVGKGLSLLSY